MAERRRLCGVLIATFVVMMLLPAFSSAGPVRQRSKGDVGASIQEKAEAAALHRRLIRNRRNISWYKQHSDFWAWYKYFTDNGNQEAVQEMDKIYLAYLQNKNRAEARRSYRAYLRHLGEIYKSCADSDDPSCVASYTARPQSKPEPPKPAPMKTCDPTKDAHCLYMALSQGKSPYMPLVVSVAPAAPAKAPAPLYVRAAPQAKDPASGHYYYSPSAMSFLSREQKAELLRICSADDVECLQYHLRAAYGYRPSAGPLPSYSHLGCDPKKDPSCTPKLVQKAPSGLYLQYPNCDPQRDPYCAYGASLMAPRAPNPPAHAGPGSCNPLFEDNCNPLTATRFSSPPEEYRGGERDEAASIRAAPPPAEQKDPYAMFRDAYANANRVTDPYAMYRQQPNPAAPQSTDPYNILRQFMSQAQDNDPYAPRMSAPESNPNDPYSALRDAMNRQSSLPPRQQYQFTNPSYEEPTQEERHPLGPPGKTKEGYDCYIGYDSECFPVRPSQPRSGAPRHTPYPAEAYQPSQNPEGPRSGILEPENPHCDPEYDPDCRLRRYEPEQPQPEHHNEQDHSRGGESEPNEQDQYEAEPYQSGQEEPYMAYTPPSQGMPSLQDILRSYGDRFPEQDDHRAYAADYRRK
ncbi:PREDICTED: AT-rich interactive domain-containing protein 1A-like [Cyprinodon variegatus]|uniref:Actinodin1 n=1 Tax=Cyprinodon variegatus TaxID=28743 RepID=A0A3Q2FZX1_CYPVA|nr:PREDICTED: AT-rich interactive domain-containing protein 1A-like [Cyprinodon variegatus]XP_015246140.1 PREDICTED: AT-rich interactive domain-containing protein 1A-like [Cyprinodon variegatus]